MSADELGRVQEKSGGLAGPDRPSGPFPPRFPAEPRPSWDRWTDGPDPACLDPEADPSTWLPPRFGPGLVVADWVRDDEHVSLASRQPTANRRWLEARALEVARLRGLLPPELADRDRWEGTGGGWCEARARYAREHGWPGGSVDRLREEWQARRGPNGERQGGAR